MKNKITKILAICVIATLISGCKNEETVENIELPETITSTGNLTMLKEDPGIIEEQTEEVEEPKPKIKADKFSVGLPNEAEPWVIKNAENKDGVMEFYFEDNNIVYKDSTVLVPVKVRKKKTEMRAKESTTELTDKQKKNIINIMSKIKSANDNSYTIDSEALQNLLYNYITIISGDGFASEDLENQYIEITLNYAVPSEEQMKDDANKPTLLL